MSFSFDHPVAWQGTADLKASIRRDLRGFVRDAIEIDYENARGWALSLVARLDREGESAACHQMRTALLAMEDAIKAYRGHQ